MAELQAKLRSKFKRLFEDWRELNRNIPLNSNRNYHERKHTKKLRKIPTQSLIAKLEPVNLVWRKLKHRAK
ncbi:hypothetical protein A4A49_11518 [Nicotiana attenuata]|uniref:Uncharacterized protein n=1 Tax=Nicotiana attenuata TaxID=49451 RepID=A0A1J6IJT5_NICAT|nr:hypothetical protein A4A49_11518 [Nicotiana attenuata]